MVGVWQLHIAQQQAYKEAGVVDVCFLRQGLPEVAVHAVTDHCEVRTSFLYSAVCCFVLDTRYRLTLFPVITLICRTTRGSSS